MSFEYIEIKDKSLIPDCVRVHKAIFHLNDSDAFPSIFFNMLIRNVRPLGMVVGCFKKQNENRELIGLTITVADFEIKSLYCILIGVLPAYQNGRHGYLMALKVREEALKRGINKLYGIYDPLDAKLGKLYSFLGVVTTNYIQEPVIINEFETTSDKVMFEWHLDSERVNNKLNRTGNIDYKNDLNQYNIINETHSSESEFLFEIPSNYHELKILNSKDAEQWRIKSGKILSYYLNNEGFNITECISKIINGSKKTYYLLSNKFKNESFNQSNFSIN